MATELINCISKYTELTEAQERALIESAFVKQFPKGTILLKEGDLSNECYFIFEGCIRSYCWIDSEEKTTEFYTEEQAVSPSCYGKNIPSEIYLECLEDTIVTVGTPELEATMFQKYPELEPVARVMNDILTSKYQDAFAAFRMASPEQRYLNLLKTRPDLIQRAPQNQIATYLGIKPQSLSRIRRRIAGK